MPAIPLPHHCVEPRSNPQNQPNPRVEWIWMRALPVLAYAAPHPHQLRGRLARIKTETGRCKRIHFVVPSGCYLFVSAVIRAQRLDAR